MKKVWLILFFVTSLFSLDIITAVKLGLENENRYVNTDQILKGTELANYKLDIRLIYIKFLENREKLYITVAAIRKGLHLKEERKKMELDFLDVKYILESIIGKNIKDNNSIKKIDFSLLQNHNLKSSNEISSLEKELNEYDKKKSNIDWNVDVSGDIRYRYEIAKKNRGRKYKDNDVDVGVSIVLSKNRNYENDSTIDIAKKRYDLEKAKLKLDSDVKSYKQKYVKALKKYKLSKSNLNKNDLKNLKTIQEIQKTYNAYMNNTKALYAVYVSYVRLLHIIQ